LLEPIQQAAAVPVKRLFVIGFGLILIIKLVLASALDLYSDEIFYWLASTRPALAYSDLPFMTSQLVGLGTTLGGNNAFAVRICFLLLGTSLPFLVYWVARPLTNQQQALESAALTLCLPLAGFLGLLAVPDVPLLFFGILALGNFERALRTDAWRSWILTGVAVAAGLSTHYRFFLYPLAAIIFLACTRSAHTQWRNKRLWSAMLIASIGLIPVLWFNLNNHLSSASFYFVDRHPWTFHASGLLHLFKQAGLVTPLLYGVFIYTLWRLVTRARAGDQTASLFASFAITNLALYLILAPWTDATSTSIHWPLSGYIPLLIFVPASLREIFKFANGRWQVKNARKVIAAIPLLGFIGTLVALLGVGSQAYQQQLQALVGTDVISNKMAGWKEFAEHTTQVVSNNFSHETPIVVTDNYYTAAQAEFAGITAKSYTLDQAKAVSDGRLAQLQLWRIDEMGLREVENKPILFITEDSTLDVPSKHEIMRKLCQLTDNVEFLGGLSLFQGAKQFSYYAASRGSVNNYEDGHRYQPCPFPARAWLDSPNDGDELLGTTHITGWAYNEDIGVQAIQLLVDGERFMQLNYGNARPDVVEVMQVKTDPQAPALGIDAMLDTTELPNGHHRIELELTNMKGIVTHYGTRIVTVAN